MAAAFGIAGTGMTAANGKAAPHPIDLAKPYRGADYRFIGEAVGDRPVVGLGESIHLTKEMPRVRLNVLRYLHEKRGFNVLALEGSLIDAWTAQEHAYASSSPVGERARIFTREALFGLWQTDQMQEVIAYALESQRSSNPLYLTSFDLQPGNARAYGGSGEKSLNAFLLALRGLDGKVSEQQIVGWARSLGPALTCKGDAVDMAALQAVEQWILGSASAAAVSRRPTVHVAALRLVPVMLRNRLQHCKTWQAADRSMRAYQEARDLLNAQLVLALLRTAPKLLLWAHHSHLHHNSLGKAIPSTGQHLKQTLGDGLYTIGVFALTGAAVDTTETDKADGAGIVVALAARPMPSDGRFGVENKLAQLRDGDFFLDLRNGAADLAQPSTSRLETTATMPTALSRDFDGAILLHRIEGAELNFLPSALRLLINGIGWVFQHVILAALIALLCLAMLIWTIKRLWNRRRSKRKLTA